MMEETYKALVAEETGDGIRPSIKDLKVTDLPDNDLLIKVLYSSLNYKDALSSHGNRGITKHYPHTPGIDSCGIVVRSRSSEFKEGDYALVCGNDLGMNTAGGFGQYISVPADWAMHLPEKLSPEESMMLGTAGFTAALAIHKMQQNGQHPSQGPVLVTGASGGLGSLAINILAKLGYDVIAATGKTNEAAYLKSLGASEIFSREDVDDKSGKLLIRPRWAGAVDTVGGNILATVLKGCQRHGNIACCGNAKSPELNTTVFPFILNGVNLLGVDSATTPMPLRKSLWQLLQKEWRPDALHQISETVNLHNLPGKIELILQGKIRGRIVVKH
jgi:acrylyl-CoA reductase (NADPH)